MVQMELMACRVRNGPPLCGNEYLRILFFITWMWTKESRAFYLHFGKEWKSRKEDVDLYSGNNIHYYYWMCREKQGKPPLIRKECILVRWEKPDSRHTTYAHCQFTHQFGGQRSIQKSCYQICRGRLWRGKNVKLANYLSKWEPFLMGNQEK